MASYVGHLTFSSMLAAGYGAAGSYCFDLDWGPVFLGAGLTAVGGLLPDLDSASGVPVRELFGLAAVTAPLLLLPRLQQEGLTPEQTLVILAGIYLVVRYGVSSMFKKLTVHRGMFHSIPALLIAGLAVFLLYTNPNMLQRLYLAGGVTLGFLSHLILDELCSVSFSGVTIQLNQFAGSALKLFSKSWPANLATYALLLGMSYLAWLDLGSPLPEGWQSSRLPIPASLAPQQPRR